MEFDEKKLEGIITDLLRRERGSAPRRNCPAEEELAGYLEGNLDEKAGIQLEAHLAVCSLCVENIVAVCKSGAAIDMEKAPRQLVARAMALFPGRETLVDLAVRLVKDSIELLNTSARVISKPIPAVRGEVISAKGNALQVEQEVGRFRVAVELDLKEPGVCQLVANVTNESGEPAEGVRLSLSAGEREQASFLTRGGVVVFDRIAPGEYSIAVSEAGNAVGRIRLNLMLER